MEQESVGVNAARLQVIPTIAAIKVAKMQTSL